jgi:hypothetical protein
MYWELFMKPTQIAFPFRAKRSDQNRTSNSDLIGRGYEEDHGTVTVIGLCPHDNQRVLVRREPSGGTYSMAAWLMRFALMDFTLMDRGRKRAA